MRQGRLKQGHDLIAVSRVLIGAEDLTDDLDVAFGEGDGAARVKLTEFACKPEGVLGVRVLTAIVPKADIQQAMQCPRKESGVVSGVGYERCEGASNVVACDLSLLPPKCRSVRRLRREPGSPAVRLRTRGHDPGRLRRLRQPAY
jgi:hypothetical protein